MVFRPCIDIHAGKVKQIVGSSLTGNDAALVTNFEATMGAADFAMYVACVCVCMMAWEGKEDEESGRTMT